MKKLYRNKLLLSVAAACLNGVFVGSMSASVFATSSLNVTIANTISLDIMPKSTSGTFARSSTSDNTVSVSTDNYTGYTLSIAASNANDNSLSYKEDNTVIDSIASHSIVAGVSSTNYANDTYAASNSLNNTWGYRPSTYYDTTNNTNIDNTSTNLYFPAPTSTSVTTLAKTTTANPSEADNYNIAIGARVGIDKTPGAYTNTLVITVVANATPYSLTYNANAGGDSTVANMPSSVVSGTSYADTITLSSTVPTRTGYTFAGWCTTNTSQTSCSGTLYNSTNNNLDSFPIDRTASSNSLNAYAIWTVNTYSLAITFAGSGVSSVKVCAVSGDCTGANLKGTVSTSGDSVSGLAYGTSYYLYPSFSSGYALDGWAKTDSTTGASLSSTSDANPTYTMGTGDGAVTVTGKADKLYMQNLTSSTIATLLPNKGDTATVYDSRDEQAYTIAKLEDGKYWMVENLNLAGGTALSADNTDVTSEYISGFTGSADESTSPRLVKSGNTITLPTSDTAGFGDNSSAFVYNSGNKTTTCNSTTPCYSYYSWIAATLGGMQSDGSTAQTTRGYNAAASICPKGWRLPTSTTSNASPTTSPNWKTGDWYALATAYGANLESNYYDSSADTGANFYNNAGPVANSVPNFLLAGYYGNGSFRNGGSYGHYWSATSCSSTSAYDLLFYSSYVYSADYGLRRLGYSVRCIFYGQ